jgi:uncharacterized protein YgbK (DUF1537 family)
LTDSNALVPATDLINSGRSVVLHSRGVSGQDADDGERLSYAARDVMERTSLRRVLVAGGDTSGHVAKALRIQSLQMVASLTRGAPLCRATAPGISRRRSGVRLQGGQIGPLDFFSMVQNGTAA